MSDTSVLDENPLRGLMPVLGYKQCPTCGSWDTTRHTQSFRVWFTCDRCGAVFS
jgi:hypothetical protein